MSSSFKLKGGSRGLFDDFDSAFPSGITEGLASPVQTTAPRKRCFETHPPLPIKDFKIYGGSCVYPVVTNADIYVGFDRSMPHSALSYPWNKGESVLFPIQDMSIPTDPKEFIKLIEWLAVALESSKLIHLGCLGGHGRTGLALSALVKVVTGDIDAISYVRKHYCSKVVESQEQVGFLHSVFGIAKVASSKNYSLKEGTGKSLFTGDSRGSTSKMGLVSSGSFVITPTQNPISVWG